MFLSSDLSETFAAFSAFVDVFLGIHLGVTLTPRKQVSIASGRRGKGH